MPLPFAYSGNWEISSPFGEHHGLDFAIPLGTPVTSTVQGTVTEARVITRQQDPKGSYGVYVVVQDQQGNRHFFSHLQGFYVSVGDSVAAGDLLGTSGTSGNSSGPHLHYEIRGAGGAQIDPTGLVSDGVVPGFPAMKPDQQQTIEEFNAEDEGFAFADLDPKGLRQATEDLLGTKIQPRLYAAVLSRGKMDEELTRARAQVVSERGIEGLAPEEDF